MRSTYLALILITVGCGDNLGLKPDASRNLHGDSGSGGGGDDGPLGDDDAPSGSDAGPGSDGGNPVAKTRIWTVGDLLTDGVTQAMAFDDGATLPFGTATPPPIVIPSTASGAQLFSATAAGVSGPRFSATPDGKKIAFVANLTTAGEYDLYVANGDGTNIKRVLQNGLNQAIQAIQISPDGTKIAFTQNALLSADYDLFIVAAAENSTAVRYSPDRTALSTGTDVLGNFQWSRDSRYVAFLGDLHTDKINEVFVVDSTVAAPVTAGATPTAKTLLAASDITPQASGNSGASALPCFDSTDKVYFTARVSGSQFNFFRGDPTMTGHTDITSIVPKRTADSSTPSIGMVSTSPDGTELIVAADTPVLGDYEAYATKIGTPTVKKITAFGAAGALSFSTPFWFSSDGKEVAFAYKPMGAKAYDSWVAKVDGTDAHRVTDNVGTCSAVKGTPCAHENDTFALQWNAAGDKLYVLGTLTVDANAAANRVYVVDPTMTNLTAVTTAIDAAATTQSATQLISTGEP